VSVAAIPILAYHSIAPGERVDPNCFAVHMAALARSGLPSLFPDDLGRAPRGAIVTFDDGFADLWTHGLGVLETWDLRAVVFAIPTRCGEGAPRPRGHPAFPGRAEAAHREAALSDGAHPGFLRWSELAALEATGRVVVQSHGYRHAMGWVGKEILGFHLGERTHWSLPQCTGGDIRLGVPLYRRGAALAHRLYFEDPRLRDDLARWLEGQGGAGYVAERGPAAVGRELARRARTRDRRGRWETERERDARVTEDLIRARETLEARLGGRRDELCLPWGEYDPHVLSLARRLGVSRVYTLDRGPNRAGRIGFTVNRFEPRPRGQSWLRLRLWIYRSVFRTRAYGLISRR
jgi:peptidoglycan/xylan/chitin deacetylase (PgdA/CDA1 family)